jgi:2-polyprenyl-3-methyl-5-hydroxy-6-metoxy-1,4-benzoquinol methylase
MEKNGSSNELREKDAENIDQQNYRQGIETATAMQLEQEVSRTPEAIRRRYRENRHWRLYPKEWIYRNIDFEGKDVLDFGCGTGEISTQIALLGANRVYALDINPELIEMAQQRAALDGLSNRVETIRGPLDKPPPRWTLSSPLPSFIIAFRWKIRYRSYCAGLSPAACS